MTGLTGLLVASAMVVGQAEEMSLQDRMKIFDPLIGKWSMEQMTSTFDSPEAGIKEGDKLQVVLDVRKDINGSLLITEAKLETEQGASLTVWTEIAGFNPITRQIEASAFGYARKRGWGASRSTWVLKGNALVKSYEGHLSNELRTSGESVVTFIGEDQIVVKNQNVKENGESVEADEPRQGRRMKE